jgi:hypothetical protein
MTCIHCGQPVTPCPDTAGGCTVRCLHDHPVRWSDPPIATRRRPCLGWQHLDGWHICDPSASHKIMAEVAP